MSVLKRRISSINVSANRIVIFTVEELDAAAVLKVVRRTHSLSPRTAMLKDARHTMEATVASHASLYKVSRNPLFVS
ncbi:hypothetical protein E2542_SST00070 [Spatholobus suberectus]|nr:hypothetical protein E2542_SST00070 [Spatholobus suberectus]